MALSIQTTGLEDYIDGSANIRMLVIAAVGAGKTRMASWWPKPIYADCESGRASIADRHVPYTEIKSSQDMLDFLAYLKAFESRPRADRPYQTVVIDTLDGFQRKVFDERLQQTRKATFSGFDDWGYLDSKMQMLMTRLLNLDLNVIVNCHFKDKTAKDSDGNDIRELMLQLKGDIKDSAFTDFDLVGWLGTYWQAEAGERVEARGLTFKRTPDKPFLKDRYGAMPSWVPISLTSEQDYEFIRDALLAKVGGLTAGEVVGEIPTGSSDQPDVAAGSLSGGPLPAQDPRDVPLHQFDKATLVKLARDEDITTCVDGTPIKGNTIKAELLQAIEYHRALRAEKAAAETDSGAESPPDTVAVVPDEPAVADSTEPESAVAAPETVSLPVDTVTGEISPVDVHADVVPAAVTVIPSETVDADNNSVTTLAEPAPVVVTEEASTCEWDGCSVDLSTQDSRYVQLANIYFQKRYCGEHYAKARATRVNA